MARKLFSSCSVFDFFDAVLGELDLQESCYSYWFEHSGLGSVQGQYAYQRAEALRFVCQRAVERGFLVQDGEGFLLADNEEVNENDI